MGVEVEVQTAVYTRLNGDATLGAAINGVYDHVPDNSAAPYVVIGDDDLDSWLTMGTNGFNGTLTVHTWTEGTGMKECKTIMGLIYGLLHKYNLSVSGYNTAGLLMVNTNAFKEADNRTFHGVQQFQVWLRSTA